MNDPKNKVGLSWESELARFRQMSQLEQIAWLSELLFLVTICARGTYEAGTDQVTHPADLRRFNELIHRIACFQKKVVSGRSTGMPDYLVFELIEETLARFDVDVQFIFSDLFESGRHDFR